MVAGILAWDSDRIKNTLLRAGAVRVFQPLSRIAYGIIIQIVVIRSWLAFAPSWAYHVGAVLANLSLMLAVSLGILIERFSYYRAVLYDSRAFILVVNSTLHDGSPAALRS